MRPTRAALLATGLAAALLACDASPDEDTSTASGPPFDVSRFTSGSEPDKTIDRRLPIESGYVEAQVLRDTARERLEERVQWTRAFIVSRASALPDADAAASRLFQNGTDLGKVLRPFYGSAAADEFATLLDQQTLLTMGVLHMALQHDTSALQKTAQSAYANAHEIAAFLAALNPDWIVEDLDALLRSELDAAFAEMTARISGEWTADVAAHDDLVAHARSFADVVAGGIVAQFPERILPLLAIPDFFHERMREVWEERAAWVRSHLVSRLEGLPDEPAVIARLLQNGHEIARIFSDLYGVDTGDALEALLTTDVYQTSHWLDAIQSGDLAAAQQAQTDLQDNGHAIVTLLAAENGWFDAGDIEQKLRTSFERIQRQARHRMSASWSADVGEADRMDDLFRALADSLTLGIEQQLGAVQL